MTEQVNKPDRAIVIWLFTGCFLVFAMVIVGGITRLTGSGLSITEWNVVMGTIPPINDKDWQLAFDKYKESPQFIQQNFNFELHNFKNIFWWEYIHRLVGRLIGIVFIVPFVYFLVKKQIDKPLLKKLLFIFFLGGLQGFLGWFMVKSGLVNNPRVSHYRLAIHLVTAFITFGFIWWTALSLLFPEKIILNNAMKKVHAISVVLFFIAVFQIIYGAFVAGLHAGHVYNTFPKMGDEWIPVSTRMAYNNMGLKSFFENPASVQFIHRCTAYLLVAGFIFLFYHFKKGSVFSVKQTNAVYFLGAVLSSQFLLGVFTVLYSVPVALGVFHQMGAFFLFASLLYVLHALRFERR